MRLARAPGAHKAGVAQSQLRSPRRGAGPEGRTGTRSGRDPAPRPRDTQQHLLISVPLAPRASKAGEATTSGHDTGGRQGPRRRVAAIAPHGAHAHAPASPPRTPASGRWSRAGPRAPVPGAPPGPARPAAAPAPGPRCRRPGAEGARGARGAERPSPPRGPLPGPQRTGPPATRGDGHRVRPHAPARRAPSGTKNFAPAPPAALTCPGRRPRRAARPKRPRTHRLARAARGWRAGRRRGPRQRLQRRRPQPASVRLEPPRLIARISAPTWKAAREPCSPRAPPAPPRPAARARGRGRPSRATPARRPPALLRHPRLAPARITVTPCAAPLRPRGSPRGALSPTSPSHLASTWSLRPPGRAGTVTRTQATLSSVETLRSLCF